MCRRDIEYIQVEGMVLWDACSIAQREARAGGCGRRKFVVVVCWPGGGDSLAGIRKGAEGGGGECYYSSKRERRELLQEWGDLLRYRCVLLFVLVSIGYAYLSVSAL
ncbi:hypothetical protein L211DRAFT_410124 [Terfezia boudieri ATCC MYA-4762]|uniref:Uncharacterized protein n=1 Tax=Terfezia boudieri ATCC MYA-4762 TaxID=1051890 RepID=A0A3N4LJL2_9PEZI|nr:hypothetical protein L211DRAFT_410124 [Terfezia boudieri ATCC MYA-4762]